MDEIAIEPAGFGIRVAARLIDYMAVGIAGGLTLGIVSFFVTTPGANAVASEKLIERLGLIVGTVIYHTFSESVGGATLGKRLFGLEVVNEALQPATLLQTLKRSLAFLVDSFFFGLVGYNAMKKSDIRQRLGDQWAETRVVRRRSLPPALRRPTNIFVFAFLGGAGIAAEGFALVQIGTNWFFA